MMLENGAHGLEGEEEKRRRKGHMKTSSISERERKIGHRRVNEAGQVSYKKVQYLLPEMITKVPNGGDC